MKFGGTALFRSAKEQLGDNDAGLPNDSKTLEATESGGTMGRLDNLSLTHSCMVT
jgi:hypothetical protein